MYDRGGGVSNKKIPNSKSLIESSIQQLSEQLVEENLVIAVAESCTGGMLAQWCTSRNGSSNWFECGFVTYTYASKIRLLGVQANVLDEYGAVSSQIAEQMAAGALSYSDADVSASITGIAGPGGGSESKPVGTVFIATAVKNQPTAAVKYLFKGDRQSVREQSVHAAIEQLIKRLYG